jgi:hypothetical protein
MAWSLPTGLPCSLAFHTMVPHGPCCPKLNVPHDSPSPILTLSPGFWVFLPSAQRVSSDALRASEKPWPCPKLARWARLHLDVCVPLGLCRIQMAAFGMVFHNWLLHFPPKVGWDVCYFK